MTTTVTAQRVMAASDATELVGVAVDPHPPSDLIDAVYLDADTGAPVLAHFPLPGESARLRAAVRRIQFGGTYRTGLGISNRSQVFGWSPRKPVVRRESCQPTALARDHPDLEAVLDDCARDVFDRLEAYLPDVTNEARAVVDAAVLPEWTLEGTAWTSGVVNETSQLPYHRDAFNFPLWSAMPVVRRGVSGGHLHIPEYDITVPCHDRWVVAFPGYQLVHGVTPMTRVHADGYRISVVFYSLRGMKDCHTYAVEVGEARRRRTAREVGMAQGSDIGSDDADQA